MKGSSTAKKSTKKSTTPEVGTLVPQPGGRGALRYGGTNKGGTGRPPSELRRRMRGTLDERLDVATDIIENGRDSDRLGALTFLARFGLGDKREGVTVDVDLLNQFYGVVERHLGDDTALAEIKEAWLVILADRLGV